MHELFVVLFTLGCPMVLVGLVINTIGQHARGDGGLGFIILGGCLIVGGVILLAVGGLPLFIWKL